MTQTPITPAPAAARSAASSGALPKGYREVLAWKITDTRWRLWAVQLSGLVALFVFGVIFGALAIVLGRLPARIQFQLGDVGLVFAGLLLTLGVHELTHGLFMRLENARPQFGVMWKRLMLYTTSPGFAYRRNGYIVITLAPLILISVLVVLGMLWVQGTAWVALLAICGAINASGAIGDMWITALVLRYPTTAYVMDERDGIQVFARDSSEPTRPPGRGVATGSAIPDGRLKERTR